MATILPRLRNLLSILATETGPLPVQDMADRLRVSRRTVFRELAGVGSVLGRYDLEVGSKTGEGIVLEGSAQARNALLADLGKLDRSGPADRRDRQDRLLAAILRAPGQKLAAHAARLGVSAPTVSHDLDDIELWLAGRGLVLQRKPGTGIAVEGGEMAIRRAILTLMYRMEDPPAYPHPDILLDLFDLAPEMDPLLDWMTPQSRDALCKYMAVAAQRLMDGHALPSPAAREEAFAETAARLAATLGEAFNIRPGPGETAALEIEISSCRPNVPREHGGGDASLVLLAGEMAARFDPARAPLLKMDEVLTEGLVNHLRTAVIRLRHRIELADPMREQIAKRYPDVLLRSRRACGALPGADEWLPEDEVSLVAAHFGAALLRLPETGGRRRMVRVGVICVHGIGSSYLLASQVKRAFGARALVEVGWRDDREKWRQYDVLVSTVELPDAEAPVAIVPPILGDDDIRRIGEMLDRTESAPEDRETAQGVFVEDLRKMETLAAGARSVMERFALAAAPRGIPLAELPRFAGERFGGTPEAAEAIAAGLAAREAVSTQVIPELRTVLLHCKTEGAASPLFGVLRPAPGDGAFSHPSLGGARCCVVMLLPSSAPREIGDMMGRISAALIERERFLDIVQTGEADRVLESLERILGEFLFQFTLHKLKG